MYVYNIVGIILLNDDNDGRQYRGKKKRMIISLKEIKQSPPLLPLAVNPTASKATKICRGLFLGDWADSENICFLEEQKIGAVLCINLENKISSEVEKHHKRLNISTLYLPYSDAPAHSAKMSAKVKETKEVEVLHWLFIF